MSDPQEGCNYQKRCVSCLQEGHGYMKKHFLPTKERLVDQNFLLKSF